MLSLRYLFVTFLFLIWGLNSFTQSTYNLRDKKIPPLPKVQRLDTLSIIQDSFIISGPGKQPLDPAFYRVDFVNAIINLSLPEYWENDSLHVVYRVYPIKFSQPYFHKDTSLISAPGPGEDILNIPLEAPGTGKGLIPSETLISSGSITRGVTLGNQQDVTLNSSMNLQLSGWLSEEIEVAAVISDQDIPFQPDGTTRQLQDFDKVFIRLSGLGGELTAGDFELERPESYFMNFSRRAQGGKISYTTQLDSAESILPGAVLKVTAAGAVAKGKYARQQVQAVEGSQGPYKLKGANNEPFIMVLAGSEKVYIDGVLLQRGMDYDYVIDYNMAEITFTTLRLITKDSRIVVEFEYAERNFARSIMFSGVEIKTRMTSLRFNFFSEQDHPNQPLFQELSDERIDRMSQVGDSLHLAFDWNVDSTGFFNDRVMYRLTDSLGVDTVFVYSTDPQEAVYQVGFTHIGEGQGNYRQVSSAANGRVFQWIAPVDGMPQGTHDPVIQLVTPKRDRLMTMGADFQLSEATFAGVELALSNKDLNLFSSIHEEDNNGFALRINAGNETPLSRWGDGNWVLHLSGNHEVTESTFSPLDRYRPVEFARDWNLQTEVADATENLSLFEVQLLNPDAGMVRYRFRSLFRGDSYQGILNNIDAALNLAENNIFFSGGLLNSEGNRNSTFYRHKAGFSRPLFVLTAGVEHQMEYNSILEFPDDRLSPESFSFDEWTFYITNPDTLKNRYRLFYKTRLDKLPGENSLKAANRASDIGLSWDFLKNPDQRFHMTATYRRLRFIQPPDAQQYDESTLAGRIDYFSRWGKGVITSSLFYEAASGMERQREYIYLEVPAGQGIYTWNDYNENGIMELDEFEVAQFADQANFIRVFVQTEGLVRIFSNVISHTLNIDPSVVWKEEQGYKRLLSRFYNQLVYRADRKTIGDIAPVSFNPFGYSPEDEALVSLNSSFRNTLFFNRADPVFGAEINYNNNRNKILLSNGFETRLSESVGLGTRWNLNRNYSLNLKFLYGTNDNLSEFFLNRNYRLEHFDVEPMVSYQIDGRYRISLLTGLTQKQNLFSEENETAKIKRIGGEFRYSSPQMVTISGRYQISDINYPFNENTPLAFEMLEGLRSGTNHVWNLSWQQNLNAWLQLIVAYNGRKPSELKTVHAGNVQLRALF